MLQNKTADIPEAVGLGYIQRLFAIEKSVADMTLEDRITARNEQSKIVVDEFFDWIDVQKDKTLPQSLLGKAIQYAENQKKYLIAFLKDPRIEISNNRAERSIKPFVIGRKNWLFCNTPKGAGSSAVIYSIIETAKENGLNPYKYLCFIFEKLKSEKDVDINTLLPWADEVKKHCSI